MFKQFKDILSHLSYVGDYKPLLEVDLSTELFTATSFLVWNIYLSVPLHLFFRKVN